MKNYSEWFSTLFVISILLVGCGVQDRGLRLTGMTSVQMASHEPALKNGNLPDLSREQAIEWVRGTCEIPPPPLDLDPESNDRILRLAQSHEEMAEGPIRLSSRPLAPYKLYLDFDGQVLVNTYWNFVFNQESLNFPPIFDENKPVDRAHIIAVWQLVAEHFAPFDVDVTTIEPRAWRFGGPNSAKTALRVIISHQVFDWYPAVAGLAIMDSGFFGGDLPVLAIPGTPVSALNLALIVSHEVGHAFGLSHDGVGQSEFHHGIGDWGPIMGSPYNKRLMQWSKGEYEEATNGEDDIYHLQMALGSAHDDIGSEPRDATEIRPSGLPFHARREGLIYSAGDVDLIAFDVKGGGQPLFLSWGPVDVHGNSLIGNSIGSLVARVEVLDHSGTIVATTGQLPQLPKGQYFLRIIPHKRDWQTSSYGSLGRFAVSLRGSSLQLDPSSRRLASPDIVFFQSNGPGGLLPKLTPVAGATEYVIERSEDQVTWTEMDRSPDPDGLIVPPYSPRRTKFRSFFRVYAVKGDVAGYMSTVLAFNSFAAPERQKLPF
jgi:hypothetical protein